MAAPDPRIDAYLATLPDAQREALERLRTQIAKAAPDAVETISYGMPTFKLGRQFLVSFAGWKEHCALYPLTGTFIADHAAELEGYGRTKGSVHFTPERPLPAAMVERLVRARIADIESGGR
jgi:uncharacterized protein YdhG (YjbR/CyaY superfamily)